ncbi:hypothetical protein HMPREF0673_00860 [Leyella stercorea DSM 18206]|uniref:Uncharacterized protein n=1 Tax=Leyella stercorea DSM 18206 TaxID=1002367 RepID=G6AW63_9BACT|nr:hypothetical protein HMPREF0673_00860 [Leyella stercorea DSM 18206]
MSDNTKGGALVSARLCRLPEQEVHQCYVSSLIALLVHLRQVHPLNNPYNKSVCEKILHICQFCRNPQIIRTIKAGR